MLSSRTGDEIPDIAARQRVRSEFIKCVRKLRWMGLEEEAKRLQIELRDIEPAISALAGPHDTD
jgi:hypothetical protein